MGLVVDSGFVVSRAARTFDGFGCLMLSVVWFGRSRAHQVDEDPPCGASQRRNHSTGDPSAKVQIGSLSVQSGLLSCWKAKMRVQSRSRPHVPVKLVPPVESSDVPGAGNVKRRAVLLCCLGYSVDGKPRVQSFRVAVLALWIVHPRDVWHSVCPWSAQTSLMASMRSGGTSFALVFYSEASCLRWRSRPCYRAAGSTSSRTVLWR